MIVDCVTWPSPSIRDVHALVSIALSYCYIRPIGASEVANYVE